MQVGVFCLLFLTKPFPVTQIGAWQSIAISETLSYEERELERKDKKLK
ncbi:hypothetical protein C2W64_03069 [Brevibacillus laterosporus]|nr:hypothetical protein C2W64_03069 [Brevibacillus laterosporus]